MGKIAKFVLVYTGNAIKTDAQSKNERCWCSKGSTKSPCVCTQPKEGIIYVEICSDLDIIITLLVDVIKIINAVTQASALGDDTRYAAFHSLKRADSFILLNMHKNSDKTQGLIGLGINGWKILKGIYQRNWGQCFGSFLHVIVVANCIY